MTATRQLRVPPHSIDAEQAVLGGLMFAAGQLALIADWLHEDDFYRRDHALLFRAISTLVEHGGAVDAVTVGEWFEANGLIEQVGGMAYVVQLQATTPSAANLVAYAEIVAEKSRLRKAIDAGNALVTAAFDPHGKSAIDVVSMAQQSIAQLQSDSRGGGLQVVKPLLKNWFTDLQRRFEAKAMPGLPTPWHALNTCTHGMQDGEVIVVAARSNMGKSVFGMQLAMFSALRKNRTAVFSLEMREEQVVRRNISALGSIPHDWLLEPVEREDHWSGVTAAVTQLRDASLLIDDAPRLNAAQIIARAKREHLRQALRLVVVDHLHEMAVSGKQGEVIERADALRELKRLAKDLRCPVVVLAQLNRGSAADDGRRPRLTDLRGSGGIEEVADVVLFLHREDYYRGADSPQAGVVEVIVGKGRDVRTGTTVHLTNRFDCMRLDDWSGPLPAAPVMSKRMRPGFGRDRAVGFDA